MAKTISDEIIISALISNGTIKAAANSIGVTERTIYDRMSSGEFKALYKSVKADVVRKAVFELNNQIGAAVETIVTIMQDQEINPAIRLQAAQTILNNANKFAERLNTDENRVSEEKEKAVFSLFEF
ncbi:MAG: hypothetical protein K6G88_09390 [Lachnospiraceae bacterium]|nr:hypothetical protein [Lachnospiraceae bacterium]